MQDGSPNDSAKAPAPDEEERPRLAREVARRAMADASRNGILMQELITALRELDGAGVSSDRKKENGQ